MTHPTPPNSAADLPAQLQALFLEAMEWGKYYWAQNENVHDEVLRVVSEGFADKAIALAGVQPAPKLEHLPMARSLTDELMDCVDRLGSEADQVDPRVWDHLLVYAPKQEAQHFTQALTDPENQPNQCGVEFGMSGTQMHFKIGNQLFNLAYEPDDHEEFEFMKRMLINAFSNFTLDVKTAHQQEVQEPVAWRLGRGDWMIGKPSKEFLEWAAEYHADDRIEYATPEAPQPATADVQDAARYRWLRDKADWDNEGGHGLWLLQISSKTGGFGADDFDRDLDAAMSAQKGGA